MAQRRSITTQSKIKTDKFKHEKVIHTSCTKTLLLLSKSEDEIKTKLNKKLAF
jgi:hypothetical protein